MDFKNLKKQSSANFDALVKKMEETNTKKYHDDRYWNPTVDKEGNGFAIIRFLPTQNEDIPFIRMFSHGFKSASGAWYIENSRTTIGEEDPLAQFNSWLWNSTSDDESPQRKQARAQKRQLHFISNIRVIRDQGNPANEGKVFLYKYGKKVWDKLNAAMHPEYEGDVSFNPFDLWNGANFRLKIAKVAGFRNYDRSEFDSAKPLAEGDAEMQEVYESTYSLQELLDPKNFKSYAELDKQLRRVIGAQYINWASGNQTNNVSPVERVTETAAPREKVSNSAEAELAQDLPFNNGSGEAEDPMSYYEQLAAG